jgi:hypothetical protein
MPEPGQIKLLVLLPNLTYTVYDAEQQEEVQKQVNDNEGSIIFRLEGYLRKTSTGEFEPSVRSQKVWPK